MICVLPARSPVDEVLSVVVVHFLSSLVDDIKLLHERAISFSSLLLRLFAHHHLLLGLSSSGNPDDVTVLFEISDSHDGSQGTLGVVRAIVLPEVSLGVRDLVDSSEAHLLDPVDG